MRFDHCMRSARILTLFCGLAAAGRAAEDWPTYRHDAQRSGSSEEGLSFPLQEVWRHAAANPPCPAWPPPARQDVSHGHKDLSPTHIFDRAYHLVGVGNRAWYASSADDALVCLDAGTGRTLWVFRAEAPIRLAPTVWNGRLYVGSDDGCVYCLQSEDGTFLWKARPSADRRLPGNGRIISRTPVRSSVAVLDGLAYFTAGIFPSQGVFLCAVDATTGEEQWKRSVDVSSQGYLLASPKTLFLPTGRTGPAGFVRSTGKALGTVEGIGSCFGILLKDMLVTGPNEHGQVVIHSPDTRERIVSMPGLSMVAGPEVVYVLQKNFLTAFDRAKYLELSRKIAAMEEVDRQEWTASQGEQYNEWSRERKNCEKWTVPTKAKYELIRLGEAVLCGGDGLVEAHDARDGKSIWSASLEGQGYGLSAWQGRLYVSTDRGVIHCFSRSEQEVSEVATVQAEEPFVKTHETLAGGAFEGSLKVRDVLRHVDVRQGYCLLLGARDPDWVGRLVERTHFRVVIAEREQATAQDLRSFFAGGKLYGNRVSVHLVEGDKLPFCDYFANLVLAFDGCGCGAFHNLRPGELSRVQRPCGGVVILSGKGSLEKWGGKEEALPRLEAKRGLSVSARQALEGGGKWTHTYAEPGNSACSRDSLVRRPFELQWFGGPGPRDMVDRHFRNVPPLYDKGRLFVAGNEIVYCVDAYNGFPLWELRLPGSRRLAVFLDASGMAVHQNLLHVVTGERCDRFQVENGKKEKPLSLPKSAGGGKEWGYLACVGTGVLGSLRPEGTTYQEINREANLASEPAWYPNMKLAASEAVFYLDSGTGKTRWMYDSERLIDTTFAVGKDKLFFLETHSSAALADDSGRLTMREMNADGEQLLVALDLETGERCFKEPLEIQELQQPAYLSCAEGILLLSGSRIKGGEQVVSSGRKAKNELKGGEKIVYTFFAFDAGSGHLLWKKSHPTDLRTDGGHGEYNRHPTIIEGWAYCWPYAYDLKTGERKQGWKFSRHGHGCGGISGSLHALFWRGWTPWTWDLRPGGGPEPLTRVTRPGCWINMLPVGGLVLIPEASSGCTCTHSIQTSMALVPK